MTACMECGRDVREHDLEVIGSGMFERVKVLHRDEEESCFENTFTAAMMLLVGE